MSRAAKQLRAAARERVLIKDGAYGTEIQARKLVEADYRGDLDLARDQRGNNDLLCLTRPEVIRDICENFADAGAQILATNTFNANRISLADYGAEHLVGEINRAAAGIARRVANSAEGELWVAGALGPTNKTLSLSPRVEDPGYREVDFDGIVEVYSEQIAALVEGGVDFLLIETVFDTLNAKAAIMAAQLTAPERPLMLSMTITDMAGRNLSGHSIEAFWATVRHARPLTIGLNCSFGADKLRPAIASLSAIADTLVMAYPNAGLPTTSAIMTKPRRRPPRRSAVGSIRASSTSSAAAVARRPRISPRSLRRRKAQRRALFPNRPATPCSPASNR